MKYHIIPQLITDSDSSVTDIELRMPVTDECCGEPEYVGTGMSRGVDSFTTAYEYIKDGSVPEDMRLNLLTFFNVGAHHGHDVLMGQSPLSSRERFEGQVQKSREVSEKLGCRFLVVDSNLAKILGDRDFFTRLLFDRTHTYRNLGTVTLFSKKIKTYFYSSTYNMNEFRFKIDTDAAKYEKWLLPLLSNGSTEFYSSNRNWSRMEKLEKILDMEESYDNLNVCIMGIDNCGKCEKCRRTLMELDALDALDRYRGSFDIDRYMAEDRERWFSSIYEIMNSKGAGMTYYRDTFMRMQRRDPALLDMMPLETEGYEGAFAKFSSGSGNLRRFPTVLADITGRGKKGDAFVIEGVYGNWIRIKTDDDTGHAYVHKDRADIIRMDALPSAVHAVVAWENVNVRDIPAGNGALVIRGKKGDKYDVIAVSGDWAMVRLPGGKTGYAVTRSMGTGFRGKKPLAVK